MSYQPIILNIKKYLVLLLAQLLLPGGLLQGGAGGGQGEVRGYQLQPGIRLHNTDYADHNHPGEVWLILSQPQLQPHLKVWFHMNNARQPANQPGHIGHPDHRQHRCQHHHHSTDISQQPSNPADGDSLTSIEQ